MITKNDLPKGRKVYYEMCGETAGPLTVKRVRDTAVIPMVSFKESEVSVGINYIKLRPNDKVGKLSEYLRKQDDSYLIKNVYEEGINFNNRSLTQMEGIRNAANNLDLMFFRPNHDMIKWLVKYAAGRLIIDAGCGSGRITCDLNDAGARIVGVDPFLDMDNASAINRWRIQNDKSMIHFLQKKLQDIPYLYKGQGNKVLLLFARPCHSKQLGELYNHYENTSLRTFPNSQKRYRSFYSILP